MICRFCEDVNLVWEIRQSCDLVEVIQVIRAKLEDGTLNAVVPAQENLIPMPPFEDLKAEGPWPDYFVYVFECSHCELRFKFEVETYHGAGGFWRPI